jgi:hypothetical protein
MTKRRSDRARTMGEEILDRAEAADPQPETPLTGASKATSPPRPKAPRPRPRVEETEGDDERSSG